MPIKRTQCAFERDIVCLFKYKSFEVNSIVEKDAPAGVDCVSSFQVILIIKPNWITNIGLTLFFRI